MRIKKIIALLLSILLAAGITGCGQKVTQEPLSSEATDQAVTASFCTALLTEMANGQSGLSCDTICGFADENFTLYAEQLYGLTVDSLADGCILYQASGAKADEISILTPADAGKGATVKAALQQRAAQRVRDFTGYNDAEARKAEHAEIIALGSHFALIISDDPNETAKLLRQTMKKLMTGE